MENEEINPKEKIDADLKKIIQLSNLLLDSNYENYDAGRVFEILSSAATSVTSTYYFEVKENGDK